MPGKITQRHAGFRINRKRNTMAIDSDIQLWLETRSQAGQTVVTPYLKSSRAKHVHYQTDVTLNTAGGTSSIRQGGEVDTVPGRGTAIGQVAMHYTKTDACHIRIRLHNGGELIGNYIFGCPLP